MENGMKNDDIISSSDMILKSINLTPLGDNELISSWKKVVSKINKYGERLAGNSKVIDLKNGVLLVEVDHSVLVQLIQMNSKFIINGLKMYNHDLNVISIACRLKGSEAKLSEIYNREFKKSVNEIEKKNENNEEFLRNQYGESDKKKETYELPNELKDKFESIKRSVLTNNKK